MSCEGNRQKFFEHLQAALGLDARTLEKTYQSGKAAGVPAGQEEKVTAKTRFLFDDMRRIGLTPPTHSPDGLPKMDSRAGYAAVFDILRAQPPRGRIQDFEEDLSAWPLDISQRDLLNPQTLLNNAGFSKHRYLDGRHVWLGHSSDHKEVDREPLYSFACYPGSEKAEVEAFRRFMGKADTEGYLSDGYSPEGFDRQGFDLLGYSLHGLSQEEIKDPATLQRVAGHRHKMLVRRPTTNPRAYRNYKTIIVENMDVEGFSADDGFHPKDYASPEYDLDRFGFNRLGFRGGRSWTGYDENGLDANGQPAPTRRGYDAWGYERSTGLTAPDEQGRRYNLIGWQYDPATGECFDPQDPSKRMKHEGSWGYNTKLKKVVLKRSYIPSEDEMKTRLRKPSIRWNEYLASGRTSPLLLYHAIAYTRQRDALRQREALILASSLPGRYLRSEEHEQVNPGATFLGVHLRCPHCGQFTGAVPHSCPAKGGEKILTFNDLTVALRKGGYKPNAMSADLHDALDDIVKHYLDPDGIHLQGLQGFLGLPMSEEGVKARPSELAPLLWRREKDETAVVIETKKSPLGEKYDPDFYGGPMPGFHWKSGLDQEGRDPYGFHYLTGKNDAGLDIHSVDAAIRVRKSLADAGKLLANKGKTAKDLLEESFSRIATAIAGAARTVRIEEKGGPRPAMFWTDMRGRIQAERYPLQNTPRNTDANNLLALKAGLYHELGHEEDTPLGIFQRVMDIANGKEDVEGLPRGAAGIVAEVYNILEDGRMERQQAKRRRGTAAILAAAAMIEPRWDEKVGEDVPFEHQIMGMMLYRSLPFFEVRREVFDAAPERVRRLYLDIEPLIDRAMRSPEDAFQASIEISRRLVEASPEIKNLAERMTSAKSQGGRWAQEQEDGGSTFIIISALPRPGSASANRTIPIPPRGWTGEQDEQAGAERPSGGGKQDEQTGAERPSGGGKQDEQTGAGRPSGGGKQDEQTGAGRPSGGGKQDEQTGMRTASSSGESFTDKGYPSPEPDAEFFRAVKSETDITATYVEIASDIQRGIHALTHTPLGKALQRPLDAVGDLVLEDPDDPNQKYNIITPTAQISESLEEYRARAREEGRKIARRLEVLKEEIHRRVRLKTSGELDRKRFKRAIAGSDTVYRRSEASDVTSLAVSLQLDMSGSMEPHIWNGELAATTLALEEALQRLGAAYMVTGFGSEYALFKSFGDKQMRDESVAAMFSTSLGGTVASPAMKLGLLGLRETYSANKLHIVMTDGDFYDNESAARQTKEMRQNGIIPFGIYFGDFISDGQASRLDNIFGAGNWARIERLSDLSEVVARRIEQIYRKILATK